MQSTILLGAPSYGNIRPEAGRATWRASKKHKVGVIPNQSSLLAHGFNQLLCQALNTKAEKGWDKFALLHSDIAAQECWLDVLIEEMERVDADIISAVVPIKNDTGITSTAIDYCPTHVKRLTMKEIFDLPETFCATDTPWPAQRLLVNTGCMVFRLDRPWLLNPTPVSFEISGTIVWDEEEKAYRASVDPEDWKLSRLLAARGCKVYATRKVKLEHWGEWGWGNDHVYGDDVDGGKE